MKYTSNYNLKKPDGTDVVNIEDLNENADIIDQALKAHDDALATKETPQGAQEKADAALNSAKQYTDQEVGGVAQVLAAHKTEKATREQLGHVKAGQNITIDPDGTINAKGGDVNSVNGKTGDVILTASDVGAVPTRRRVNSKELTSDITIDVPDIPGLVSSRLALGLDALAEGDHSVALGYYALAAGPYSVALGASASTEGITSVAVGPGVSAAGNYSVALGSNISTGTNAVGLGGNASAKGANSIALGFNASAAGPNSIALGGYASAGNYSVALGYYVSAENANEGILGGTGSVHTSKWKVPGDFTVSGTKNFEIPHPKPEKSATHVIRHSSVESPTPGDTLYRWKIQATKDNDIVTIDLPDYFVWLNKDIQIFVTSQGHFGNGYGVLNRETEQLEIHCQLAGEYNVLVIGTRNDDHQSVQEWYIKGVEREIGESWTGETYAFSVDEIIEIEEIKEVS